MSAQLDRITSPADGSERVEIGGLGIVWKIEGVETGERFSVVHHPLAPRALAAPLHRHTREDEYSYVLEGTLGALLGDEVVTAGPGTWVFKPRNQWHTFWNAGDTPCEIIEIISPAGFENFFRELAEVYAPRESPISHASPTLCRAMPSRWTRRACPASASASGSCTRWRRRGAGPMTRLPASGAVVIAIGSRTVPRELTAAPSGVSGDATSDADQAESRSEPCLGPAHRRGRVIAPTLLLRLADNW